MPSVRDKLWIWGQTPGTHHGDTNPYRLPGENRMTAIEGAYYLGVPNCCRVVSLGLPKPPFDQEAMVLDTLDRVVWSIIGCGGSGRNNDGGADVDEVLRIARLHPNVTGAIMDDFFTEARMAMYPPAALREYRNRLHEEAGRRLDLWAVLYTHEMGLPVQAHLAECDVVTLWTWWAKDIPVLENNLARLRGIVGPDKPVLAGCYMWDYGGRMPMPMDLMRDQLDTYRRWLLDGRIDGIIFCSNCIADLELKAVDYARQWIREHGREELKAGRDRT